MAVTVSDIDNAITAINDYGQSMVVDGIQYSRANLMALIKLRDIEKSLQGRTAGTRPVIRAFDMSNMGYS